jgi:hypothetical protein
MSHEQTTKGWRNANMEGMSEMHHTMSHMHHMNSNGIVAQALGFTGRLSAQLLIVLTSAPVLHVLVALALLLAVAALLRPFVASRMSQS